MELGAHVEGSPEGDSALSCARLSLRELARGQRSPPQFWQLLMNLKLFQTKKISKKTTVYGMKKTL